ncbi:MAG: ImmA/IrrE family metallo-endopeptidase [Oscillospiraceae bacterium]|nr:ImmA/IrrE family metallo-endopeptidase [Oscillospiraceae bacterium]
MADIISIAEKAMAVKAQWRSADIWELLDRLGIITAIRPLGSAEDGLKGYCTGFFGQFYVCVNQELPDYLQELIAWHELGHIILDPDLLRNGQYIGEQDPLHMRTKTEQRANIFAAEGAVDDSALLDLLHSGDTVPQAAAKLLVPESFIVYKAAILRAYGEEIPPLDLPDAQCLAAVITGAENL